MILLHIEIDGLFQQHKKLYTTFRSEQLAFSEQLRQQSEELRMRRDEIRASRRKYR